MGEHRHAQELAAGLPQEWRGAFRHFVETGEADTAFRQFLDSNKAAQAAVEAVFNEQTAEFERIGLLLRASQNDRPTVGLRRPRVGDRMDDGTVYSGLSPDTGKAMYTTPNDAPLTYTFNQARKYAARLDAHGHKGWRVPTKSELNVLFENRAAIGGFVESGSSPDYYWSKSQDYSDFNYCAWGQRFSDGHQNNLLHGLTSRLRCVC